MPPIVIEPASRREVEITVGKVFNANRGKILALNRALNE
jgi:hypothetical protein